MNKEKIGKKAVREEKDGKPLFFAKLYIKVPTSIGLSIQVYFHSKLFKMVQLRAS